MSPKKKNKSSKKKVIKKEIAKDKPKRKLIPFTAGRLPCVSKAMPEAASAIPLVSKEIPLVSKPIPLVSATPNVTLPRYWGIMPSKKWGASKIPVTRKRKVKRPKDIGLFSFLGKVITAPYQPVEMVKGLTAAIHAQAEEEKDPRVAFEQELLELKIRFEMGEISDDDYKLEQARLKRKLKNLEEKEKEKKEEKEEKAKEVKKKPKRRKKPKKRR